MVFPQRIKQQHWKDTNKFAQMVLNHSFHAAMISHYIYGVRINRSVSRE